MMKHEHVFEQIPDYVLGLLSTSGRRQVEQHVVHCRQCRQVLQHERRMAEAVRSTLQVATQPSAIRLRQQMPAIPRQQPIEWQQWQQWQRGLAPIGLVIVLLFGALGLRSSYDQPIWQAPPPASTLIGVTATLTQAPTATATEVDGRKQTEEAATIAAQQPTVSVTPSPVATPIAALYNQHLNEFQK